MGIVLHCIVLKKHATAPGWPPSIACSTAGAGLSFSRSRHLLCAGHTLLHSHVCRAFSERGSAFILDCDPRSYRELASLRSEMGMVLQMLPSRFLLCKCGACHCAMIPLHNGHMARAVNEARLVNCEDMLLLLQRCAHHLVHELHCLHCSSIQELQDTTHPTQPHVSAW